MIKATDRASTIRPAALQAGTIYFPEIHHPDGNYFPETTLAQSSMADVVGLIASGEVTKVRRVIAMNIGGSECWDASASIAASVLVRVLDRHGQVPAFVEDFLDLHLGSHNVAETAAQHRVAA